MHLFIKGVETPNHQQDNQPPGLHEFRGINHHLGKCWKVCPEPAEDNLELRNDLHQQNAGYDASNDQHCDWVIHRTLDFGFERFRFLFVGRQAIEHGFKCARLLSRLH